MKKLYEISFIVEVNAETTGDLLAGAKAASEGVYLNMNSGGAATFSVKSLKGDRCFSEVESGRPTQ